jgi:hypothetical protein
MTSASPPSGEAAADVIEQDRGMPRWLGAAAGAAAAAVTTTAVLHAALSAHRAGALPVRVAPGWQPTQNAPAAQQVRSCSAGGGPACWPRQPFAAVKCSLPAQGASASGPAEALLVRQTQRYSMLVGSACR